MLPLTVLGRMLAKASQGIGLGVLAIGGMAIAVDLAPKMPVPGMGLALIALYFAVVSLLAATRFHVQFRFFYLGASAFGWLAFLAAWLSPSVEGCVAGPLPWSTLGMIAVVTAGVLVGKATMLWAFTKAPTHW